MAKWLLSAEGGASLHERDKNQNSALLIAAWSGKLEMVKWYAKRRKEQRRMKMREEAEDEKR